MKANLDNDPPLLANVFKLFSHFQEWRKGLTVYNLCLSQSSVGTANSIMQVLAMPKEIHEPDRLIPGVILAESR